MVKSVSRILGFVLSTILLVNFAVAQCPAVDISSLKKEYCLSDFVSVSLNNAPAGSIISWNVGNGWDTTTDNHSFAPSSPGWQDISARFTLVDGTLCQTDSLSFVYIHDLPNPSYSVSESQLCRGAESVVFSDLTPKSESRTWLINGKRFVIKEKSWNTIIDRIGGTSVTLIVQDSFGCRNTKSWSNVVKMYDDINLDFTKSSLDNCVPVTTNFSSTYTKNQQTVTSYNWSFPSSNKLSANAANVSGVTYNNVGRSHVVLTVETNQGCTYRKQKSNFMTIGDTIEMRVSASKQTLCLSEPVTLTQHRKPVPGSFKWDIGSSSQQFTDKYTGEFTFRDTGTFDLKLTYNHNNCISEITENDIVKVGGQKAIFTSQDHFHCEAPHTITLKNESDTISDKISSYFWEIKDSETGVVLKTSANKNLAVTIDKDPSLYDVMLVTTAASSGCKDTALREKFIKIAPYQFDFFATPPAVCTDQEVKFHNRTKSSSYYGLDLFSWEFLNQNKSAVLGSSAASISSFSYTDEGYYHARLTAANPLGCQQIRTLDSAVHVRNPKLAILPADSLICSVDFLQFKGNPSPKDANYQHTYVFRHIKTGTVSKYIGDSVLVSLPEIGDYELLYHYGTDEACSDTLRKKVYANGIKGAIVVDSASGCSPLTVRPRFVIEQNSHIGSNDTSLSYNWSVSPRAGATLLGASSPNPILVLEQDRQYRVSLFVTNSSGCSYSTVSDPILLGVKGIIDASNDEVCLGDTVILTNNTLNNPSTNIWSVLSSKVHKWVEQDSLNRIIIPQDTGSFLIKLIVSKDAICTDTVFKTIRVASPKADFSLINTQLSCAPFNAQFKNNSIDTDSLFWDFGDGNTRAELAIDTISYEYLNNSTSSGFDVSLIAKNNFGCYDTVLRTGIIKLSGPIAEFEILNGDGCEPNLVSFINKSSNYDSLFFQYGTNLETDTNTIQNFSYWNNSQAIQQKETPVLTVRDNNGCEAIYSVKEGVRTNNIPKIELNIDSSDIYCQRQQLIINDTGQYATSWEWSLNDSIISKKRIDTTRLIHEGLNTIKVFATNSFGCIDSAERSFNAESTTEIDFLHPEVVCKDKRFQVIASTSLNSSPTEFRWDMGELNTPGNIQVLSVADAFMSYRFAGLKKVHLAMDLDNGCTIRDSTIINCFDSDKIRVVDMLYAQFTNDNDIETIFNTINVPYFAQLNFYRNNELVKTEDEQPIQRVVDSSFLPETRNCYNLSITDICGVEGEKGRTHCPINLAVALNGDRQVKLDWTYYVGWDKVEGYAIHRQYPDSAFKPIDTVFNTQKSYIDSIDVCDVTYKYKVVALKAGSNITSQSNTVTITPTVDENTSILSFDNISVPDNEHIELRWSPSQYRYNNGYMLTKHAETQDNLIDSIWVADSILVYTDSDNVTPEEFHYYYKLHQVDNCKKVSKTSEFVKTILLSGSNKDSESKISWTKYEDWDYPIIEHHIEHLGINGKNYLDKVSADVFTYRDNNFYEDIDGYYFYQIHAVNSNGDTSYSNIAYISGDGKIYVPNSFSPNSDGLNDVFRFETLFITNAKTENYADFELAIYNRWGQKVFQTNDLNEGWNGYYQGKRVPKGVYQFRAKFTDGTEKRYFENGVIHVVY